MDTESGFIIEWRIENFSQWCAEVHGNCIKSSKSYAHYFVNLELYPKGISGQDEHLGVRLFNTEFGHFTGGISFHASDGSQLYPQQMFNVKTKGINTELVSGPKLADVLFRIRDSDDVVIVRCWVTDGIYRKQRMCTTLNAFKLSLKLNSQLFVMMNSNELKKLFFVHVSTKCDFAGLQLSCLCEKDTFRFSLVTTHDIEFPIAVEMSMRNNSTSDLRNKSDICAMEEHIFKDESVRTILHSLDKRELVETGISVLLDLNIKTCFVIQDPYYYTYDPKMVSVELSNYNKSSGDESSSGSVITDQAEDSVTALTTDLMCLFQDQDLSDVILKCDDVTFPAHRNILSARSPVFKTMLSCDMKEAASGRVVITDLDPSTLSHFLTFLYTGAVGEEGLLGENALNLYYAADKYQVPSLKRECANFLRSHVFVSNVCDILSLANKHQDVDLTSVARDFILKNYNNVLKSKEWKNFMSAQSMLASETLTSFAVDGLLKEHVHKN